MAVFLRRLTGLVGSGPRRAFNAYESTEADTIKLMTSEKEETLPPSAHLSIHLRGATRGTDTPYYASVSLLELQTNLSLKDRFLP